MDLNLESVAFVSSLSLAALAIYLSVVSFNMANPEMRRLVLVLASCFFIGGAALAVVFLLVSVASKKLKKA